MKNIMSLMVTQKKSKTKKVKEVSQDSIHSHITMDFIPYINHGSVYSDNHQKKDTRDLIMCADDEKLDEKHQLNDRDYITHKLIHEQRIHLSSEQNRQLINYTLKLLMPQKSIDNFKKQGLTIKEISDHFMVHSEIVYMRLNLTE